MLITHIAFGGSPLPKPTSTSSNLPQNTVGTGEVMITELKDAFNCKDFFTWNELFSNILLKPNDLGRYKSVLGKMGLDSHHCDVVIQNTVLKILRKFEQFNGHAPEILHKWFNKTLRRTAIDYCKKLNRERRIERLEDDLPFNRESESSANPKLMDLLESALSGLKEKDRQYLITFYSLPTRKASQKLAVEWDCPQSTVLTKIHYAKQRLITELKRLAAKQCFTLPPFIVHPRSKKNKNKHPKPDTAT